MKHHLRHIADIPRIKRHARYLSSDHRQPVLQQSIAPLFRTINGSSVDDYGIGHDGWTMEILRSRDVRTLAGT